MKCGLICARRARNSASMTRVRCRPSSASSIWVEIQRASSSVARTSPAEVERPYAARTATTWSSATIGAKMPDLIGQSGSPHVISRSVSTRVRPEVNTGCACRGMSPRWWVPAPSHASVPPVSLIATASEPSIERRCLVARDAPSGVSPSRNERVAKDTVCRV